MKPSGRRLRSLFLVVGLSMFALTGCDTAQVMPVLSPQGPVARSEYYLIIWSFALMVVVVLGVFILYFYMLFKYRAKPENKDYVPPEIEGNSRWESIWTIIPVIIIIALAIPTVAVTYNLVKPPKAVTSAPVPADVTTAQKTLTIDVVSERWKWVFKYPEQGIETVNYCVIPANEPINFQVTSSGPMNGFWVPALGGMIITMPNKDLRLWLQADHPNQTYKGMSSQYSGRGFADMTFDVNTKTQAGFNAWVQQAKQKPPLTKQALAQITKPGLLGQLTYSSTKPQ